LELGYGLRLAERHDEEVSRVLSIDGLPEKEQWVQSRDGKQTSWDKGKESRLINEKPPSA